MDPIITAMVVAGNQTTSISERSTAQP